MEELIGNTAGQIWQYLDKQGPVTIIKLKSELGISNSTLYLALGWLSREDKINIIDFEQSFKISLKNGKT